MARTSSELLAAAHRDLTLTDLLDALRDPLRREIVRRLAKQESLCSSFADLGSPSGLSYHFTRLRTAGLTNTRKAGTCRLISLRKAEVEKVFPGLLSSILAAIEAESPLRGPSSRQIRRR